MTAQKSCGSRSSHFVPTATSAPSAHDHAGEPDGESRPEREQPPRARDEGEQRRVDDVELLLHAEGPEVLQWRRRSELGQVVRPDGGEVEVGEEDRRPSTVDRRLTTGHDAQEEVRGRDRGDDHERGGGEDATATASVEGQDRRPAGRSTFAEEDAGDDEAGDHEEDVDADVAAGQGGEPGMEQHDQEHGDSAETFDVGPERPVFGGGARFVS